MILHREYICYWHFTHRYCTKITDLTKSLKTRFTQILHRDHIFYKDFAIIFYTVFTEIIKILRTCWLYVKPRSYILQILFNAFYTDFPQRAQIILKILSTDLIHKRIVKKLFTKHVYLILHIFNTNSTYFTYILHRHCTNNT